MSRERRITLRTERKTKTYIWDQGSGNVYEDRGFWGGGRVKCGNAKTLDDAIAIAKSDAREKTGESILSVEID